MALVGSASAQAQSDDSKYSPPLREAIAAYRVGDLDSAEKTLRTYAARDPDAEAWLGAVLIDRGNNREAMKTLQQAADAGSSEANHRLGLVFAEGQAGMTRNDQRSAEYFEKAANAGHRRAEINLGILYLRGQGVARDLVQARAWLEKAAANDDPNALYTLGRAMEEHDNTVAADSVRAADLYRRAAEKGHALAALRYGLAMVDGLGVKRDPNGAQTWLLQANDSGVPEAALALGDLSARTPASRDKEANALADRRARGELVPGRGQGGCSLGAVQARQCLLRRRRHHARSCPGTGLVRSRRAAGPARGRERHRRHADRRRRRHAGSGRRLQVAHPRRSWRIPRFPRGAGEGEAADVAKGSRPGRETRQGLQAHARAPDRRYGAAARHAARARRQAVTGGAASARPPRQARPDITLAVCRGACRLMRQAGHSVLLEMPLPDGRRADIFAVARDGALTIVETKSSIEDWRVDDKWPDYLNWCDLLYVAVPVDFPQALIPEEIGLIVADAYGGEILLAIRRAGQSLRHGASRC